MIFRHKWWKLFFYTCIYIFFWGGGLPSILIKKCLWNGKKCVLLQNITFFALFYLYFCFTCIALCPKMYSSVQQKNKFVWILNNMHFYFREWLKHKTLPNAHYLTVWHVTGPGLINFNMARTVYSRLRPEFCSSLRHFLPH